MIQVLEIFCFLSIELFFLCVFLIVLLRNFEWKLADFFIEENVGLKDAWGLLSFLRLVYELFVNFDEI